LYDNRLYTTVAIDGPYLHKFTLLSNRKLILMRFAFYWLVCDASDLKCDSASNKDAYNG